MKPKTYSILERAVEEGASAGYHRSYKYDDAPNQERIVAEISNAVMLAICEVFEFDNDIAENEADGL
jgi:hypothetical protein